MKDNDTERRERREKEIEVGYSRCKRAADMNREYAKGRKRRW